MTKQDADDKSPSIGLYSVLLTDIKTRIRQAQVKATLSTNTEMILMYWDIGKMIHERQKKKGWGTGIIPRLAKDIRNELTELKGFSERNIKLMTQFYREYPDFKPIVQWPVAQLEKGSDDAGKFSLLAARSTRALPKELRSSLPSIEKIEAELSEGLKDEDGGKSEGGRLK